MLKFIKTFIAKYKYPRVESKGKVEIEMKVYRAKKGKWEDLGVVSSGKVTVNTNI